MLHSALLGDRNRPAGDKNLSVLVKTVQNSLRSRLGRCVTARTGQFERERQFAIPIVFRLSSNHPSGPAHHLLRKNRLDPGTAPRGVPNRCSDIAIA